MGRQHDSLPQSVQVRVAGRADRHRRWATRSNKLISNANAINGLAPARTGPELVLPLLMNHRLSELSEQVIKPHYLRKQRLAIEVMMSAAHDLPVRIHQPNGAMFLWTWFEDLPGGADELYRRAAVKGLLPSQDVIFPGFGCDVAARQRVSPTQLRRR